MIAPSSAKSLSFVLVVAYALAGCGGAPDAAPDSQIEPARAEAPLVATTTPAHHAPAAARRVLPPTPPEPIPPSPPEPTPCIRPITCMRGSQFDATPGVCTCVPIPDPPPQPGICVQMAECMSGLVFDTTPGVCMCVPPG